jgi:hypothetical protein
LYPAEDGSDDADDAELPFAFDCVAEEGDEVAFVVVC